MAEYNSAVLGFLIVDKYGAEVSNFAMPWRGKTLESEYFYYGNA